MPYFSSLISITRTKISSQTIPSAHYANYSCETALVKIVNDILWAMESQRVTAIMAIDLSVDSISHSILISVLRERFGITDTALSSFESYLHPQYCKVLAQLTARIENWYVACYKVPVPVQSCTWYMHQPWNQWLRLKHLTMKK